VLCQLSYLAGNGVPSRPACLRPGPPPSAPDGLRSRDLRLDSPRTCVLHRTEAITGEARHLGRGRRYLGRERLVVGSVETDCERWEYRDFPGLTEIRFRLPGVAVRVESWNVDLEKTVGFAQRLERLELDSDLLRRMKEANASGSTAWIAGFGGSIPTHRRLRDVKRSPRRATDGRRYPAARGPRRRAAHHS
jgi:hypothetical protein